MLLPRTLARLFVVFNCNTWPPQSQQPAIDHSSFNLPPQRKCRCLPPKSHRCGSNQMFSTRKYLLCSSFPVPAALGPTTQPSRTAFATCGEWTKPKTCTAKRKFLSEFMPLPSCPLMCMYTYMFDGHAGIPGANRRRRLLLRPSLSWVYCGMRKLVSSGTNMPRRSAA